MVMIALVRDRDENIRVSESHDSFRSIPSDLVVTIFTVDHDSAETSTWLKALKGLAHPAQHMHEMQEQFQRTLELVQELCGAELLQVTICPPGVGP